MVSEKIPDMSYLLQKHFSNIYEHQSKASAPHPIKRDYQPLFTLGDLKQKNNYRSGDADIASRLGVSTYQIPSAQPLFDYNAARTDQARQPTYVQPARYD